MTARGRGGPATAAELVLGRAADEHRGLLFEGRQWSWAEVVDEGRARASLLSSLRRPGPFHVGVLLENVPEYLFLLAGAALAGAVIVGANPTRRGDELARDVRHTDCQLLITDSTQAPLLEGLDLGIGADRVLLSDEGRYGTLLEPHRDAPLPDHRPAPSDLFLLIFTSGSTGAPKAVKMSQGRAARTSAAMPFTADDVLYCAMPLFHGNALAASVFPALHTGATIALRRRFSASGFLPDVRDTGATFANFVGRAIAHIVSTPPTDHDRDHRLKFVLGPEAADADKAAFTGRFGVPLFEGYGSSENAIVLQPAATSRKGALGRPSGSADVAVVDPETLAEKPVARFDDGGLLLNPGEAIGELVGRNLRSNFEGYYNNPDAEAERTRNGWFWSGDLAYRDEDGIFYFAGRVGDWLRVDSENFAAAPVERILSEYPDARGVAVHAVPDPRTGDQVMAAIELDHGAAFDPEDFARFLARQRDLSPKWVPRFVRIVDALPLTGTNKVNKQPLRATALDTSDRLWKRVGRSMEFVPMTATDVEAYKAELAANGRAHLLKA